MTKKIEKLELAILSPVVELKLPNLSNNRRSKLHAVIDCQFLFHVNEP